MGLRKKAVLISGIIVAVTSVAVYLVSYRLIQANFDRLEDRRVRLNLVRIENAFRHEAEHLETLAADYATWDSTYRYMAGPNRSYETSDISDETFATYKLRLFMLIDLEGQVALCRRYLPASSSRCGDPAELNRFVEAAHRIAGPSWEIAGSGLLSSSAGSMLVAVHPILRTDGAGPSRGVLLIGRLVDADTLLSISRLVAFPVQASTLKPAAQLPDLAGRLASVSGTETQTVDVVDDHRIAGYLRVDDLDGKPSLVLRTDLVRDLHRDGAMVQKVLFGELFIIVVLMATTALVLLQKTVLKRIAELSSTARSITGTGNLSARAAIRGNDEFAELGRAFNAMLDELDASRKEMLVVQETLEYRVRHDHLTGLLNRNAITQELIAESARCSREGSTVAVMMADLDHFKRINDELGHGAGDEALRRTSEVIRSSLRPYDRVGRFGGEEFLIVAPNVGKQDALRLAERIRGTISTIALSDATASFPTVSIGITLTDGVEDWREVICTADTALYQAKKSGRNRVEFIPCDGMSQPPGSAAATSFNRSLLT